MPVNQITPVARYSSTLITINSANYSDDTTWYYIPPTTQLLVAVLCGSQTDLGSSLFEGGQYAFSVDGQSFTHLMGGQQTNNRFDMAVCYKVNPTIPSGGNSVPVSFGMSPTLADGYMIYLIAFSEVDTSTPFISYNLVAPTIGTAGEVDYMSGTSDEDYLLMVTVDGTGTGTTAGTLLETAGPSAKAGGVYLRARGKVWDSGTTASYEDDLGSNAIMAAVSINYLANPNTLTPTLLTNTPTPYSPSLSLGDVSLSPALLTSTQTFQSPRLDLSANPTLVTNTSTVYTPTASPGDVSLSPQRLLVTNTLYAPTIAPQPVDLSLELFANTQTYYGPTAAPGAVSLTSQLYTNTQSFFTLTTSPGEVSLTNSLFTNTDTPYAPTVAAGAVSLSPEAVAETQSFYEATITTGDVSLTATMRVTNSSSFYAPLITLGDLSLTLPYTANQQEFYLPTIGVSDVDLVPPFLENSQEFYSLDIYIGSLALSPPVLSTSQEFFPPTLTEGGLTAFVPLLNSEAELFSPAATLVGIPLPEEVSGAVSVDIWTSTLDQGWGGVLIDEGSLIGAVDQQFWVGEQPEESWTASIELGWSASINN